MDIVGIIETVGIPVAVAIGLGYALMYLIKFITKDVTATGIPTVSIMQY